MVRGIGVAVMINWCGISSSRVFLLQREPLIDTEAMLFVKDDKTKPIEFDTGLEQRMGADYDLRLADAIIASFCSRFLPLSAPTRLTTQCPAVPARREILIVLLGQDFGRRHQRRLVARADHRQTGERGDHGFTRADIALHQPNHRLSGSEILQQFRQHALLGAGQGKRQLVQKRCC